MQVISHVTDFIGLHRGLSFPRSALKLNLMYKVGGSEWKLMFVV